MLQINHEVTVIRVHNACNARMTYVYTCVIYILYVHATMQGLIKLVYDSYWMSYGSQGIFKQQRILYFLSIHV